MKILAFLLLLVSISAKSDSVDYVLTSISTHPLAPDGIYNNLAHKIAFDGRVNWTQLNGVIYTVEDEETYHSYKGFFGSNSIGEPMGGASYSFGPRINNTQIGFVVGGYLQDSKEFERRGMEIGIQGNFIPILGFELNQKFYVSKDEFIKITNTLTGLMTNHAISIGKDF